MKSNYIWKFKIYVLNDNGVSFRFILLVAQFVILRVEPYLVLCHFKINSGGKLGELIFIRDFFFTRPKISEGLGLKGLKRSQSWIISAETSSIRKSEEIWQAWLLKHFLPSSCQHHLGPGLGMRALVAWLGPGQLVSTATWITLVVLSYLTRGQH